MSDLANEPFWVSFMKGIYVRVKLFLTPKLWKYFGLLF